MSTEEELEDIAGRYGYDENAGKCDVAANEMADILKAKKRKAV